MATTLDTLRQRLADAQEALKAAQNKIAQLLQDGVYIYNKSRLANPLVAGNPRGWISGSNEFWIGNDAEQEHIRAVSYNNEHEGKINAQQTIIEDAELSIKNAMTALNNYEKNSPLAGQEIALQQQQAANEAGKNKNKTLIIVTVIIVIVGIGVGVYMYFRNKKKKKASASAAAA